MAKVEWHLGELYPRVGFIATSMTRPAERVTAFYNQRDTAEQHIKEGKNAVTWTRLSSHRFAANGVPLQLHSLAYNLANFLRTLALPEAVKRQPGANPVADARKERLPCRPNGQMGLPSGECRIKAIMR